MEMESVLIDRHARRLKQIDTFGFVFSARLALKEIK